MNLNRVTKVSQAITPTAGAAGTTTINGSVLDQQGFDGAVVDVTFGAITATAVTSIKWQHGDLSDGSDMADLAGTGQTIADTQSGKVYTNELYRPTKRYVRAVVVRGTANAVVASANYRQFGAAKQPTAMADPVFTKTTVSPAAGTP